MSLFASIDFPSVVQRDGLVWFGLVSLFNGIATFFMLFNAKEQYYLTHSWEDKGVHTFPMEICPKVNVIARLEYELAYYDSAVDRFNHYTTRTPPTTGLEKVISLVLFNYDFIWPR